MNSNAIQAYVSLLDRRSQGGSAMSRLVRIASVVLLVIYLLVLLWLTLLILPGDHPSPNLVPFRSIAYDLKKGGRDFQVNFLGNIVAFMPLGILIPLSRLRPTRAWQVAAWSAGLSAGIEVAQYVSGRRVADVDDVILNACGGLLGYAFYRGWRRITSKASPARP
jgi:glycopeptide antibiotics resistance protein